MYNVLYNFLVSLSHPYICFFPSPLQATTINSGAKCKHSANENFATFFYVRSSDSEILGKK